MSRCGYRLWKTALHAVFRSNPCRAAPVEIEAMSVNDRSSPVITGSGCFAARRTENQPPRRRVQGGDFSERLTPCLPKSDLRNGPLVFGLTAAAHTPGWSAKAVRS